MTEPLTWLPHKWDDCTGTWRFRPHFLDTRTKWIRCTVCGAQHPYNNENRDRANAEIMAGFYLRELTEEAA